MCILSEQTDLWLLEASCTPGEHGPFGGLQKLPASGAGPYSQASGSRRSQSQGHVLLETTPPKGLDLSRGRRRAVPRRAASSSMQPVGRKSQGRPPSLSRSLGMAAGQGNDGLCEARQPSPSGGRVRGKGSSPTTALRRERPRDRSSSATSVSRSNKLVGGHPLRAHGLSAFQPQEGSGQCQVVDLLETSATISEAPGSEQGHAGGASQRLAASLRLKGPS